MADADAFDYGVAPHPYVRQLPKVNLRIERLEQELRNMEEQNYEIRWGERVGQLAYRLWQQRGCPSDGADDDWRWAERLLWLELTEGPSQVEKEEVLSIGSVQYPESSVKAASGLLIPGAVDRLILPMPAAPAIAVIEDLLTSIANGSRNLLQLNWRKFEDLMREILERAGWSTKPMGYTKDGCVDIIAMTQVSPGVPVEMMVQCKRSSPSNPVGIEVVREVWSVKWQHGFHQAMIATTSRFTRGARRQAQEWKLDLREHDEIVAWVKRLHRGGDQP